MRSSNVRNHSVISFNRQGRLPQSVLMLSPSACQDQGIPDMPRIEEGSWQYLHPGLRSILGIVEIPESGNPLANCQRSLVKSICTHKKHRLRIYSKGHILTRVTAGYSRIFFERKHNADGQGEVRLNRYYESSHASSSVAVVWENGFS